MFLIQEIFINLLKFFFLNSIVIKHSLNMETEKKKKTPSLYTVPSWTIEDDN